ncbi:hypothetical protein [Streptomyces sp. BK239]|uniref:hypothetical protein n=1 Tax=Streptomyces sp. BK239 TaxID=2512155 RepID=UPI001F5F4A32|nr:hypothetical protein [Streptomyces sp. BK239]
MSAVRDHPVRGVAVLAADDGHGDPDAHERSDGSHGQRGTAPLLPTAGAGVEAGRGSGSAGTHAGHLGLSVG